MAKYTKNNDGRATGPVSPAEKRAEEANPPAKAETPAEIDPIDALQLVLDLAGMIPGAGAVPDLLNAAISLMRGDVVGALFSAGAAIPAVGDAAGAAKILKNADKYAQAIKTIETKVLPKLPAPMRKQLEEYLAAIRKKIDELTKKEKPKEKAESKDDDGAKIKAKKHEVKCFKKNDKGDPDEYDRQLADQEKGLNDLTVQEYLDGRKRYDDIGRKGTGAEQAKARADYSKELTDKYETQLNKQGITGKAAQDKAAAMASDKMSTLAALHNPDMIAGGKDVVTSMGDKGVNSSIGAQWKDRVAELDKAAKEIPESERGNTKMNAKLKRCK